MNQRAQRRKVDEPPAVGAGRSAGVVHVQSRQLLGSLGILTVKALVVLFLITVASKLLASPESYEGERSWVEHENPTNTIPPAECVFVHANTDTFILHYRTNLTVREVVDASKLKGHLVRVTVFRKSAPTGYRVGEVEVLTQRQVFSVAVQPTNSPAFAIEPEDAFLIYTGPHNVF